MSSQSVSFCKMLAKSNTSTNFQLNLPKRFCERHLPGENSVFILVDECDREYSVNFLVKKLQFGYGWKDFVIDHGLLDGDVVSFHLIDSCKFKVYVKSRRRSKGTKTGHRNQVTGIKTEYPVIKSCAKPSLPANTKKRSPETCLVGPNRSMRQDMNRFVKLQCGNILRELMNHSFGWIFNQPVDPVKLNIPDYFSVISEPMDLGTIKHRLDGNRYSSMEEFAADVRLTFSNAMWYNSPEHEVHKWAKIFSDHFNRKWKSFEEKLNCQRPNACTDDGQGSFDARSGTVNRVKMELNPSQFLWNNVPIVKCPVCGDLVCHCHEKDTSDVAFSSGLSSGSSKRSVRGDVNLNDRMLCGLKKERVHEEVCPKERKQVHITGGSSFTENEFQNNVPVSLGKRKDLNEEYTCFGNSVTKKKYIRSCVEMQDRMLSQIKKAVHEEVVSKEKVYIKSPHRSTETNCADGNQHLDLPDCSNDDEDKRIVINELPAKDVRTTQLLESDCDSTACGKSSEPDLKLKGFEDFKICVNGEILDSEIPLDTRMKYYQLCCGQKKFIHDRVMKGLNSKLVVAVILEIVSITDAMKSATISTSHHDLERMEQSIKSFQNLGMAVGSLRAKIRTLAKFSSEHLTVEESTRVNLAEIEMKRKALKENKSKIDELIQSALAHSELIEQLEMKIADLNKKKEKLCFVFKEVTGLTW